ncbi:efflux RND transporter permease subunit [Shewanella waksmanii]|uniref:efflux RND transporter permease subunit n=1 Tax=Shewanella waksmanii TaxID=213783 RepID=UPI0037363186
MSNQVNGNSLSYKLIAWMIHNPIATNLLTLAILLCGYYQFAQIEQQTSPSFRVNEIAINASYPGADPSEISQSIVEPIEHSLKEHPQIDRLSATIEQDSADIVLTLDDNANAYSVLTEVNNQLATINSFPAMMEPLQVAVVEELEPLIEYGLSGEVSPLVLRQTAQQIKQALLAEVDVAKVAIEALPEPELLIEISQSKLNQYPISMTDITRIVAQSVSDVSAGEVSTHAGNIVISTRGRKQQIAQFEQLVLLSQASGNQVVLADVAKVRFGYTQPKQPLMINDAPGIMLVIYQHRRSKPIALSQQVEQFMAQYQPLPAGVELISLEDQSQSFVTRISLLLNNGVIGMLLVILVLSLLLDMRLAFWVCMGIPIAIVGAMAVMPILSIPLNMVTLFAFIITLGILVDDAVIVADNIYQKIQDGLPARDALTQGAGEMVLPVCFSVATNIIAFLPLMFVPGELGVMYQPMTLLIFAIFAVSLIEALLILPYHLRHLDRPTSSHYLAGLQQRSFNGFAHIRDNYFKPFLTVSLKQPAIVIALFFAMSMVIFSYVSSGRLDSGFVPKIESTRIDAEIEFPAGTPYHHQQQVMQKVTAAGHRALVQLNSPNSYKHTLTEVSGSSASSTFQIVADTERNYTAKQFVAAWRAEIGQLAGIKSLFFDYEVGPGGGKALSIELSSRDSNALRQANDYLMQQLTRLTGVTDIDSDLIDALWQYNVTLNQRGVALGFDSDSLGLLLRNYFYGHEVQRQIQQGQELKIRVLGDPQLRHQASDISKLLVETPQAGKVLLGQIAELVPSKSATQIHRQDGIEQVEVSASLLRDQANISLIIDAISGRILPQLSQQFPQVSAELGGEARAERQVNGQLVVGIATALFLVFSFLAIYFRSVGRAIAVLSVIPACIAAALLGHILLNKPLSVMSLFGMIALSGLVINGTFVLLKDVQQLTSTMDLKAAIIASSIRRFRPVLITALTTAIGLAPMLFETSTQAQYLIPMAISLTFGTVFSMATILLLAPALFLVVEQYLRAADKTTRSQPAKVLKQAVT